LFTGLTIVSGSIWGKPTWGTWWTWDARLTSTAVLFLVYVGYLLLRSLIDDPDARGRYAAVVGILGALNIPIVHFSVKWWRAPHPHPPILGPEPSPIDPAIGLALFVNWIAFTLLFAYFLSRRMEIARLEEETWWRPTADTWTRPTPPPPSPCSAPGAISRAAPGPSRRGRPRTGAGYEPQDEVPRGRARPRGRAGPSPPCRPYT